MTTTTTDTCLVHQTEAQSNHCVVAKSEMYPARSDLQCSDYHMCIKIMVNVHQTEAQSNHCAVVKSETCPARSDLEFLNYLVCIEIMVNVPL